MKKNRTIQLVAGFALFWIFIWIIWTWVLVLFSNNNSYDSEIKLTPEQIQELINSQSGVIQWTWVTLSTNTWTNIWTPEVQ